MTLLELHEVLGERMRAISSPDISGEELSQELERARVTAFLAWQMVRNSNIILNSKKYVGELDTAIVGNVVG